MPCARVNILSHKVQSGLTFRTGLGTKGQGKNKEQEMRFSTRSDIDPFIVMEVVAEASKLENAGHSVIHMEVGQPGTPAPKAARMVLADRMERDAMGYTVSLGIPELRRKIAGLYRDWYQVDLNPDRVIVTNGASGAFVLAFTALFDAGQKVVMGQPGYPSYRQILRALDLKPVEIVTTKENRFQPRPEDIGGDLAGLIVASPGNPAGTMLARPDLAALIAAAHEHDVSFVSDEIYHGLHYEQPAVSALNISDDLYVVNSFSKYFSMTGWRVGWMVVPEDHVRQVERLAQNMFICAPHVSQIAALAAMDCHDELQQNIAVYARNRGIVVDGLRAAGLSKFAPPDGAFYVYVDVSDVTQDSRQFCSELLHEAGLAVTPGLDFDAARGHQWVRFSYAQSTDDIVEGMARLKAFMQGRS
jgi:aspartate/methionine/tyrosine aminotransferase